MGRSRVRVGIYSLAVDEMRPWLMLTGGSDPLTRLYDRRMLPSPADAALHGGGGRSRGPQWLRSYIPAHLKSVLWDSRPPAAAASGPAGPGSYQITAVAFARGGAEVVASYSGDFIYSFDAVEHGREVEALLHAPEMALRWVGPTWGGRAWCVEGRVGCWSGVVAAWPPAARWAWCGSGCGSCLAAFTR